MGEQTKIEWCDHSASPWEGCTMVSEGCANCYAAARNHRFGMDNWGKGKPRRKMVGFPANVRKWNRTGLQHGVCERCGPKIDSTREGRCPNCTRVDLWVPSRPTVFPSLCDWLDDEVPIEWLAEFLQIIHETPNLDWLLLTKRPENWYARISAAIPVVDENTAEWLEAWTDCVDMPERGHAPENVRIGTSVENQKNDWRIVELLKIPAGVRFVSFEPLLGPVDISAAMPTNNEGGPNLDWLIIGGESGPNSRPCNVEWIRSLVRQGKDAGVPVFVKQLGARPYFEFPVGHPAGPLQAEMTAAKGGDPIEWPEYLRVREFPQIVNRRS